MTAYTTDDTTTAIIGKSLHIIILILLSSISGYNIVIENKNDCPCVIILYLTL